MTHKPEDGAIEEIILPENLLPLGSVLGEGVTPLDVSMVLAKVFQRAVCGSCAAAAGRRPAQVHFP